MGRFFDWLSTGRGQGLLCGAIAWCFVLIASGCGGSSSMPAAPAEAMGTVSVSLSDPPSCKNPNGSFEHVFVTIRSVQAHISSSAGDDAPGWQELAPQLAAKPMQIDLFSDSQTNCVLAQLGSANLPVGNYQQIRLLLVSNSPGASDAVPSTNACTGHGFNCVVLDDSSIHQLNLSSQANTGLKIPPGQIVGGPLQVSAGQSVDLNIDFNACASIVQQGNGQFRLKPVLTAGQVSPNHSGINGQILDSATKLPIAGTVRVAVERPDSTGTDRIVMETVADSNGNFRFCPLPAGPFDIVAVAVGPNNVPYNATAVLNVPNGVNLGAVPLFPEPGATAPAVIEGAITASGSMGVASIDVSLSALQSITFGSGATPREVTIPLQTIAATPTNPEIVSTGLVSVSSNTVCPSGGPPNANCATFALVVPGSNPSVGVFSSAGTSYAAPAAGDVLFSVDANAAVPMSGGVPNCTPPEITTSNDVNNQPLAVTPGSTTKAARIDFLKCS